MDIQKLLTPDKWERLEKQEWLIEDAMDFLRTIYKECNQYDTKRTGGIMINVHIRATGFVDMAVNFDASSLPPVKWYDGR